MIQATTIGYKRIINLNNALVREILLRVKQTRGTPLLTVAVY